MFALDTQAPQPLVEQIVAEIRQRIERGGLPAGTRLPSVRQLAKTLGVSPFTVAEAYSRLVATGLVEARRARGYFVLRQRPFQPEPTALLPSPVDSYWLLRRVYEDQTFAIQAGAGWLPADWLDEEGVKAGLRQLSRRSGAHLVRYGNPLGYLPLRQHIHQRLLERGIEAPLEQLVLTHGASQGLDLAMRCVCRPGDTVLVDDPIYSNLLSLLRSYGLQVMGVPRRRDGPDVSRLAELAASHQPVAFFTNTTLQNPTGTSTSPAVAHRILQLAERHDIQIVEDDIFADLNHIPPISLASLDQCRRVTYINSFSKTISPSLRVGYMVVPTTINERLIELKMLSGLTTSELNEMMVLAILTDSHHRRYLEHLRQRLADAQLVVANRLQSAGWQLFHQPQGGMFLWAGKSLAMEVDAAVRLAAEAGILLAPGHLYGTGDTDRSWFRFNVAYAQDERLFACLSKLAVAS
ncbi:PLP-dependent aminotransferase family protein [Chitinivorax sp. B]|uniref:aminotransferase-like domain-containing protein n=1 Tax=Chitinivorax sp. B TaxID=2502235 RepID=UPI0010F7774A|nr:PLP-dependent aminotransferase family protein [Chitinivorax sp. B]